jgi:hypothetical protein
MSVAPDSATIAVSRSANKWKDRLRGYRVVVDGETVAQVKRGQRVDLPVKPGEHLVHLEVDWCRSPEVRVNAVAGEVVELFCGPSGALPVGPGADSYITLGRR